MTVLVWDQVGERYFETGVDHGVLYLRDGYAVPWNGLTDVAENREQSVKPYYLDGVKYLDHSVLGSFAAKVSAFTYPTELAELAGDRAFVPGVFLHDQRPRPFHMSYRTKIGNDIDGMEHGYKIHLLYNLLAVASSPAMVTENSSSAPAVFEWNLTGTPLGRVGLRPTSHLSLDSRFIEPALLQIFEEGLYGSEGYDPQIPLLETVLSEVETFYNISGP